MEGDGELSISRGLVLMLAVIIILITVSTVNAQSKWGLGAKVIGQLPFVTGSVA